MFSVVLVLVSCFVFRLVFSCFSCTLLLVIVFTLLLVIVFLLPHQPHLQLHPPVMAVTALVPPRPALTGRVACSPGESLLHLPLLCIFLFTVSLLLAFLQTVLLLFHSASIVFSSEYISFVLRESEIQVKAEPGVKREPGLASVYLLSFSRILCASLLTSQKVRNNNILLVHSSGL